MSLVGFGQPDDGIIQMCYVVPDIRAAMKLWIDKLKVGPWFLLDHFSGVNPKYRGRDSKADVSLAMSFAGHMNIELIQPNDAEPSVWARMDREARLRISSLGPRDEKLRPGCGALSGARP